MTRSLGIGPRQTDTIRHAPWDSMGTKWPLPHPLRQHHHRHRHRLGHRNYHRFNNTSDSIERERLITVGHSKGAINNKATCGRTDRLPWGPARG